jgi:hypothetical protein
MNHLHPRLGCFKRRIRAMQRRCPSIRHRECAIAAGPVGTAEPGIHQSRPGANQNHHDGKERPSQTHVSKPVQAPAISFAKPLHESPQVLSD